MSWKKQGGSDRLPKAENIKTNNLVTNNLVTNNLASNSFQFTESGYAETSSSTTTYGYDNSTPCPQLLLVDGPVNIYFDSITQGRIYHAFWKNGGNPPASITFHANKQVQKTIRQPSPTSCDGGVIFVHDGDTSFSIGIIPGAKETGQNADGIATTGY